MPNRGPVALQLDHAKTLLKELPSPRDEAEADDNEDRLRIRLQAKMRTQIEQYCATLEAQGSTAQATLVMSIDEVEECLDSIPPSGHAALRGILKDAKDAMM